MNVLISQPDAAFQDAFWQMLDDYDAHEPEYGGRYAPARSDFAAYVQGLKEDEQGLVGIVPCSHRWLLSTLNAIVGVVHVRHKLNTDFLASEVGHIGYDVPPSHGRRGYGVAALRAGPEHAKELGLVQVVLCADTDNSPSWRTIERCGGVLDAERHSEHYDCLVRRYLITLTLE